VPAVEVAVQTGGPPGQILAGVLSETTAPLELLIAIEHAIPNPTLVLAAADALVTERIVSSLPDGTSPAERARWADVLSVRLSQAGRTEEALPPAERAAAIYRELAAADPARYRPELAAVARQLAQDDPGRYRPDLAATLVNLAAMYSKLGRADQARSCAQEAAAMFSVLARAYPDRFLPDLAIRLTGSGRATGNG